MSIKTLCTSKMCERFFFDSDLTSCPQCNTPIVEFPYLRYLISFTDENNKKKSELIKGSLKAAKFRLRQIENEVALNKYIPTYKYKDYSLKELVIWYGNLPEIKKLKSYSQRMGRLQSIIENLPNVTIKSFNQGILESYGINRENKSTLYNDMVLLKMVFMKAKANDIIQSIPVIDLRKFKQKRQKRKRYIDINDFNKLISIAREPYKSWIIIAYYTGMRRQEIVELSWDEVDIKNKRIVLSNRTKNKEERIIPIDVPAILDIFNRQIRGINSYVWNNNGKSRTFSHREFNKLLVLAGLNGLVFHDFRRCAIINFKKAGIRDEVIRSIVGHSSEITTMIYDFAVEGEISNFKYF